jgi:hypothetical protein
MPTPAWSRRSSARRRSGEDADAVPDDLEPGRPAIEAVFAALVATTVAGIAVVQLLAVLLPPPAAAGSPPAAVPLTLAVLFVSLAFAVAQAALPGPRSTGAFGLAIPLAGAIALALHGLDPAAVVSALFVGVFLTPTAYYMAIRLSFPLAGQLRRRPFASLAVGAAGTFLLWQAVRWLTLLGDRTARFPWR